MWTPVASAESSRPLRNSRGDINPPPPGLDPRPAGPSILCIKTTAAVSSPASLAEPSPPASGASGASGALGSGRADAKLGNLSPLIKCLFQEGYDVFPRGGGEGGGCSVSDRGSRDSGRIMVTSWEEVEEERRGRRGRGQFTSTGELHLVDRKWTSLMRDSRHLLTWRCR